VKRFTASTEAGDEKIWRFPKTFIDNAKRFTASTEAGDEKIWQFPKTFTLVMIEFSIHQNIRRVRVCSAIGQTYLTDSMVYNTLETDNSLMSNDL
jgi:hypothetical protein